MKINAEFDQRVVVHSADMPWTDSPMAGVTRRPLDRVGAEVARATSIVRYAADSHFSAHEHTGGEEFLVLEGVFQDEHGDFPVGSYVRNPPKSSHTPGSELGCVIFVKLWQFEPSDPTQVYLHSDFMQAIPHRDIDGVAVTPLYSDATEDVSIQYWGANADITLDAGSGIEVLVLEGEFSQGGDVLKQGSWLRLPLGSILQAKVGDSASKLWVKQGHLTQVNAQIERVTSFKSA